MKKGSLEAMERREHLRLEKTLPIKFGLPKMTAAAGTYEALSRNIGEGGAFIETSLAQDEAVALNKDTVLNLEIELLGKMQRIRPRGRIVWISRKSRAPLKKRNGFGIRFIQISPQEKRAISLFISREMLTQSQVVEKEIPVISPEVKITDRQRRNLEILNHIRKSRLISRAEISKTTGLNIVTVSNYIDNYLKKGLVFERGLDISTGGRRPELVEVNPRYGYVLGADLGPLNVSLAPMQVVACDFTAKVLAMAGAEREDDNIEDSLDILKGLIEQAIQRAQLEREKIKGIGVGICGMMDKFNGTIRNPLTQATFANYLAIKKELEDEFGLPVFIENSATCALFGEKWTGVNLEAKAADNIIYVFSDSQCAIMLKGERYTGSSKSAGQLNLAPQQPSVDLSASGEKLGEKIAYLVNVFNPQVVIVGEHFSQLGDAFLDSIRRSVNRWAFRENASIVRVTAATLGAESVALGAASLVIESVFANI